ncbi:MAG TPA: hypothetical protein PKA58_24510 [Polyangium sp.]|nr:hypothetical protein [Polyangium sp.]
MNFFVRTIHLDKAGLHDASKRRVRGGAHLDGFGNVPREDALLHRGEEDVLVDRRAKQIDPALDDDADREDRPKQDGPHAPSTLFEVLIHRVH